MHYTARSYHVFLIVFKLVLIIAGPAPSFRNTWDWKIEENAAIGSRPRFSTYPNDPVVLRGYTYGQESPIFKVEGDPRKSYFSVEANTGIVKLRKPIDRELVHNYSLLFSVSNGVKLGYGIARVTILDKNDNCPLFHRVRYVVNLREDAQINTEVLQVTADDPDLGKGGKVIYSINQQSLVPFRISQSSGKIFLTQNIDYEMTKQYRFLVIAQDGDVINPLSSSATVTINIEDLQDTPPQFIDLPYDKTINENLPRRSLVATVKAVDGDEGRPHPISYTFVRTYDFNKFSLESSTGKIRVGRRIDRDVPGFSGVYKLKVKATELLPNGQRGGAYNTTTFRIFVNDVNDNRPTFERDSYDLVISESTPVSTILPVQINISDNDQEYNSDVVMTVGWPNNRYFTLSPVTFRGRAVVRIILIKLLDFETQPHHKVKIFANETSNPSLQSSCIINIRVVNVNDNSPKFDVANYVMNLSEDASLTHPVLQVHAKDNDEDNLGQVRYSMKQCNERMTLNQSTGDLYLLQNLDYEKSKLFECLVVAKDGGTPSLSATTVITVHVTDVNDNPPTFVKLFPQVISIPENKRKQGLVKVKAVDADDFPNNIVTYSIEPSLYSEYLSIRPSNDGAAIIDVEKPFDYEATMNGVIQFAIKASDSGNLSTTSSFALHIKDENDNPPEFIQILNFTVKENCGGETTVGKILAEDGDSGKNAEVRYYITQGQELFGSTFNLNEETGFVTTKPGKSPDYESTSLYNFVVTAQDKGSPPLSVSRPMSIFIEDENDNIPVFNLSYYQATVEENSSLDHFCITAIDADSGDYGVIVYSIIAGNNEELFEINQTSGCIKNKRNIDRENTGEKLILEVKAEDRDSGLPAFAKVVINVLDVNDNNPVFRSNNPTIIDVVENTLAPSLGTFIADDADSGKNQKISYSIKSGNELSHFRYSPLDGGLQVAPEVILDRENVELYNLTLLATDGGSPPRSAQIIVRIRILDTNDNSPEFTNLPQVLHVFENHVNTSICHVTARDRDAENFGKITYSIIDNFEAFFIEPKTGELDLVRALDREEQNEFNLTVVATDNPGSLGVSRRTQAVIRVIVDDENDEKPKFDSSSPYQATVKENEPEGTPLVFQSQPPQAVDDDYGNNSLVTYSIQGGGGSPYFSVDSISGSMYTSISIDRESLVSDVLDVILRAQDIGGLYSDTVVKVTVFDVNDNIPVVAETTHNFRVAENAQPGDVVANVRATDPDVGENGNIFYRIVKGSYNKFIINNITGDIYLAPGEYLDREIESSYVLKVIVSDRGIPLFLLTSIYVTITIDDVNDSRPKFTSTRQIVTVRENLPVGYTIATLSATDPDIDSQLVYEMIAVSIFGPDGRSLLLNSSIDKAMSSDFDFILTWFLLNPETGQVSLSSSGDQDTLDREEASSVHLIFRVRDVSSASQEIATSLNTMTLQINIEDQNDNSPTFDVLTKDVFQVNNSLIVDVFEETLINSTILSILGCDQDQGLNGKVVFEIVGEVNGFLALVEEKSRADIKVASRIDREELAPTGGLGWINFTLQGRDLGEMSSRFSELFIHLRITDVNDNDPKFLQQRYEGSVFEDALVGTRVLTVFATDRDDGDFGRVTYAIQKGSSNFDVNSITGEITIFRPLDREENGKHELKVVARDCLKCGRNFREVSVRVMILVLDINDNSPMFIQPLQTSLSVLEDTVPGTAVTRVLATDPDSGAYGHVSYSLQSHFGYFSVHQSTGDVIVTPRIAASRRHPTNVLLNISASDGGGLKSFILLDIQLIDVNNNRPEFIEPITDSIRIPEEQPGGYLVTQVNATDEDLGLNGVVRYRFDLTDRNVADAFYIDDVTGKIVTSKKLDREFKSFYSLRIEAHDLGLPVQSSFKTITIHLNDINDNFPVFPQNTKRGAFQRLEVFENAVPGAIIEHVTQATDRDEHPSIYYHIVFENNYFNLRTFDIDGSNLILRRKLDREKTDNYILIIRATNQKKFPYSLKNNQIYPNNYKKKQHRQRKRNNLNKNPAIPDPSTDPSLIRLSVTVRDVIDEPPKFSRRVYVTAVEDGFQSFSQVVQVHATDRDMHDRIKFSILKSKKINSDNTSLSRDDFVIDQESGVISAATSITGSGSYYNLTIGANDRRNFSDFATVVIYVMRRSFLFHLFIDNPPEVVKDQQEELKILLENLLGSFVVVDEINNFRTYDGVPDVTRSDVTARVFNQAYDEDEIERKLKGGASKLKKMFKSSSFYKVVGDREQLASGQAERLRVVVVILSLLLILLILVFIIIIVHVRNRYKKRIVNLKANLDESDEVLLTSPGDEWQQRVILFPSSGANKLSEKEKKFFKTEISSATGCGPVAASSLLWSPSTNRKARQASESSSDEEKKVENHGRTDQNIALHASGQAQKSLTRLHGSDSLSSL